MKPINNTGKERNIYFDILRVIAMFAVVGVHICGSLITDRLSGGVILLEHFNNLGVFSFLPLADILL